MFLAGRRDSYLYCNSKPVLCFFVYVLCRYQQKYHQPDRLGFAGTLSPKDSDLVR